MPTTDTAASSKLTLEQLLKNLSGEGFSKTLNDLISIWDDQGMSKDEIKIMLDKLAERDKARLIQLTALRGEIESILKREGDRIETRKQSQLALANIDLAVAEFKGRLIEKSSLGADLDESIRNRNKEIERMEENLAALKALGR